MNDNKLVYTNNDDYLRPLRTVNEVLRCRRRVIPRIFCATNFDTININVQNDASLLSRC